MLNIAVVVVIFAVVRPSYAYMVTVDAHAEECFMEKVTSGTKLGKRVHRLREVMSLS